MSKKIITLCFYSCIQYLSLFGTRVVKISTSSIEVAIIKSQSIEVIRVDGIFFFQTSVFLVMYRQVLVIYLFSDSTPRREIVATSAVISQVYPFQSWGTNSPEVVDPWWATPHLHLLDSRCDLLMSQSNRERKTSARRKTETFSKLSSLEREC